MTRKSLLGLCMVFFLLLAGCEQLADTSPPTESPPLTEEALRDEEGLPLLEPAPGRIVISELLPGVPGNNNFEFVELYNAGTEPVNLRGWSLWYRLGEDQEEKQVVTWSTHSEVPGYGHYLLARAGEDVGVIPDGVFETALFERRGGLVLRNAEGETVDALGWGESPPSFTEGAPVTFPAEGGSMERKPGGEAGNADDSGNNAQDFIVRETPAPQNIGSPITPLPEQHIVLAGHAPAEIKPGTEFDYQITVQNQTGTTLYYVTVVMPVPDNFEVLDVFQDGVQSQSQVEWVLSAMEPGAQAEVSLSLRSPWAYGDVALSGYYVESDQWSLRMYGSHVSLTVAGGAIPIATARTLMGEWVTVEGVATMYTGGFYAGSTGTKFYLEDETGGVQVYCPGGKDFVRVKIGDRVRASGRVEVYQDALEVVPGTYPDDVVVVQSWDGTEDSLPEPSPVTLEEAGSDPSLLGCFNVVEGTVTRIEEFSYSYEVDLMDEQGQTLLVYIEKDTGISSEPLELEESYQVQGISELYSTQWQLKPRQQQDFVRIYPPELMLEMMAQNSVEAGGLITYTYTAYNHTEFPLTNVQIKAELATTDVTVVEILDDGVSGRHGTHPALVWTVSELSPGGGQVSVRYVARVSSEATDWVMAGHAVAFADQWPDPVSTGPWMTFVGRGVPIWAIQGPADKSPYVRSEVTTEGLVTGVFPELEGFWIQTLEPDKNPLTSDGIFVYTGSLELTVSPGDEVQVTGKVRERSGQTLLDIDVVEDVVVRSSANPLPEAFELNPPQMRADSLAYYEAREGMLVQVSGPAVVVAPTTKYGEYALVRSGAWDDTHVRKGDSTGMMIFVDDGSSSEHLSSETLSYVVKTGDVVSHLVGPLAYTYDNYKIEPLAKPEIMTASLPLPVLEPTGPDELSLATFNVENFFDIKDPHPSDPPKPGIREYRIKLTKTANAIVAMGLPTIIGFQEIENIEILEDLVEEPAIAVYRYVPVLIEGADSRGIDVGYLIRGDRAYLDGAAAYPAAEGLTSRPPLMITVTVRLGSSERTIYVLNNHFTSMSGGELPTEPRRVAQAAWNVTLVERILADHPDAYVVVMGDLNSYYASPPLDTLREGGLQHIYELVAPALPYTYIYQGEAETLDHILVTPSLYRYLVYVGAVHINADYPLALPEDESPRRVSDHDPLVAIFSFE